MVELNPNTLESINEWFTLARSKPTLENFNVQFGVHLEEIAESLHALEGLDKDTTSYLVSSIALLEMFADHLKEARGQLQVKNRKLFADGCGDTIVTAMGVMHDAGIDGPGAVKEIDGSNWSKYGKDGIPKFKKNGKIDKDLSTYKEPNLEPFI